MSLNSGTPNIDCVTISLKADTHSKAAFPSSGAFDAINSSLQADAAERKDAVKKGNAVFSFTLKNAAGETESWHIDLKKEGVVGKGDAPEGMKADGEITLVAFGL